MMEPTTRSAGIAGVVAGMGLLLEFGFFMASGWQPDTFADPAAALTFLEARGGYLRAAGLAGSLNLVFALVFVVGLASRLRGAATAAAATLYLGLIGITGHALVPLGLWVAPPTFAGQEQAAATAAWVAFSLFLSAAGGVGYLFMGFSMIAAGYAGLVSGLLPRALAWTAFLGGTVTAVIVLGENTIFHALAAAAFLPSITLSVVFRVWAGLVLLRAAGARLPNQGTSPAFVQST